MNLSFEYLDFETKVKKSQSISLLRSFIGFYLADKFYGFDVEGVWIAFYRKPSSRRKMKCRKFYKKYISLEIAGNFSTSTNLNLADFIEGFRLVKDAINLVNKSGATSGDDFQGRQLLLDLLEIEVNIPVSQEALNIFSNREEQINRVALVKSVDSHLKAWKAMPRTLTKRLLGVRVYPKYPTSEDARALMPASYVFSQIFSTVLRNENILTPGYSEIYFSIGETLDEAKTVSGAEDWHKYTYAAIEISSFLGLAEYEKERVFFDAMCKALHLIANFDHLEKEKIEHAIAFISKEGANTLLTYARVENAYYTAAIKYRVLPDHQKNIPFYLHLTEKSTGKK